MNPFGGTDNVTVRDLSGTATTKVDVRLNTADLRVDSLTVIGTQGVDSIKATTSGTTHTVSGLPATVNLIDPERGEKFAIDARDGDDTIDATGLTRDTLQPTLKGGAGKDTIIGSPGDDTIAGGTDVDVALMGGGLDTFTWAPGDGNDIVEGGAGTDFLQMNGSGGNDRFDVAPGRLAHAGHARHRERQPRPRRPRAGRHPARPGRRHPARRRPQRHRDRPRRLQPVGRARPDRRRQPDRPRVHRRHVRQRHDQRQRRRPGRADDRAGRDHDRARHRSRARPAARRHQARRRRADRHRDDESADRRSRSLSRLDLLAQPLARTPRPCGGRAPAAGGSRRVLPSASNWAARARRSAAAADTNAYSRSSTARRCSGSSM